MGFTDFLKGKSKKRDYAQEFKDAFENTDLSKCVSITQDWQKDGGLSDANCSYATVVLSTFPDSIDKNDVKNLYLSTKSEVAVNKELRPWFETTARLALQMKGVDV